MAAPALNGASGGKARPSTARPSATALRVEPSRRRRSTPSGTTPTTVPPAAKADRIAVTSIPRAPPDMTGVEPTAAAVARRSVKAMAASSASREPTTAIPPTRNSCGSPVPKSTGGAFATQASQELRRIRLVRDRHEPDAVRPKTIELEPDVAGARESTFDISGRAEVDAQRPTDRLGVQTDQVPRTLERLASQSVGEVRVPRRGRGAAALDPATSSPRETCTAARSPERRATTFRSRSWVAIIAPSRHRQREREYRSAPTCLK